MTLQIRPTGESRYCERCKKRVIGTVHMGLIFFRHGEAEVIFSAGSVKCTRCGHRNHISIENKPDDVT